MSSGGHHPVSESASPISGNSPGSGTGSAPRPNPARGEDGKSLRLERFLPYRLSILANRISSTLARAYAETFDLTIPEWRVMAVLGRFAPLTANAICEATQMDKVTVSRAAIALVDRGLVLRSANPDDQRSHLLSLSAEGQALYEAVAPKALALEAAIFGGFSREEMAQFAAMLERIEAAAARLAPERG